MLSSALQLPLLIRSEPAVRARAIGYAALAMEIISSATYPVFGKELATALSPFTLIFLTELSGGLFVLLTFGLMPVMQYLRTMSRKKFFALLWMSFITVGVGSTLWFVGLKHTTAVNAELFSRTQLLFLVLLSALMLQEKVSAKDILKLSIIFFGVIFVAMRGFTVGMSPNIGDMLILSSSAAFALGGILFKKWFHECPPQIVIVGRVITSLLLFFAVAPFLPQTFAQEMSSMPGRILLVLIVYGFITKFMGIYCFHKAVDNLPVQTVSSVTTLSIVGGILFANLYLGEHIDWYHVVGGSMIIAGLLINKTHLRKKQGWSTHEEAHLRQHHRHHL